MRKDGGNSSRQSANTVQPVSEQAVAKQRAAYTVLLSSLGTATFAEIEATWLSGKKWSQSQG